MKTMTQTKIQTKTVVGVALLVTMVGVLGFAAGIYYLNNRLYSSSSNHPAYYTTNKQAVLPNTAANPGGPANVGPSNSAAPTPISNGQSGNTASGADFSIPSDTSIPACVFTSASSGGKISNFISNGQAWRGSQTMNSDGTTNISWKSQGSADGTVWMECFSGFSTGAKSQMWKNLSASGSMKLGTIEGQPAVGCYMAVPGVKGQVVGPTTTKMQGVCYLGIGYPQ